MIDTSIYFSIRNMKAQPHKHWVWLCNEQGEKLATLFLQDNDHAKAVADALNREEA